MDVIDHTRALVDSPAIPGAEALTGFGRAVVPMKWVALTPLTVGVKRNAKAKSLVAAWAAAGTVAAWAGSKWGKTLAGKAAKVKQTDFQRFEAQLKAQAVAPKVRTALATACAGAGAAGARRARRRAGGARRGPWRAPHCRQQPAKRRAGAPCSLAPPPHLTRALRLLLPRLRLRLRLRCRRHLRSRARLRLRRPPDSD